VGVLTRITSQSETLIDNIFAQSSDLHMILSDVIVCSVSDPLPLLATINHPVKKSAKEDGYN